MIKKPIFKTLYERTPKSSINQSENKYNLRKRKLIKSTSSNSINTTNNDLKDENYITPNIKQKNVKVKYNTKKLMTLTNTLEFRLAYKILEKKSHSNLKEIHIAKEKLEKLLIEHPTASNIHYNLGLCHYHIGNYGIVNRKFESAIQYASIDKNLPEKFIKRATNYIEKYRSIHH